MRLIVIFFLGLLLQQGLSTEKEIRGGSRIRSAPQRELRVMMKKKSKSTKKKSKGGSGSNNPQQPLTVSNNNNDKTPTPSERSSCDHDEISAYVVGGKTLENIPAFLRDITTAVSLVDTKTDKDFIKTSDALVERFAQDGNMLRFSSLAIQNADDSSKGLAASRPLIVHEAKAVLAAVKNLAVEREDNFVEFRHVFTDIAPEQVRNQLQVLKTAYGSFLDSRESTEASLKEEYTERFR